jgi:hypothetical protein
MLAMNEAFTISGTTQVVGPDRQPASDSHACEFTWRPEPTGFTLSITVPVHVPLSGTASYVELYADTGELMFLYPLVGRPVDGGVLYLGQ